MRALSAAELLDVWEWGCAQPAVERALALLAAACPDTPPEVLARLSIGQRDTYLLTLRAWTFGPQLASLATCPNCGERLELTFNVADIQVPSTLPSLAQAEGRAEGEGLTLCVAGYEIHFRLPNSLDLAAVTHGEESVSMRQQLLERCLLSVQHHGAERAVDQLPADVSAAVVAQMTQADPQADVQLALTCPACTYQWHAVFDIVSFFWSEINAWAYRMVRDVHTLASAYGWREADILALSPRRRQMYLEMVSG